MEFKLGLLTLVVVGAVSLSLSVSEPAPLLQSDRVSPSELAALEDAFARAHDSLPIAVRLANAYLQAGQPALAIGAVQSVSPAQLSDPMLTHRLAQAYEAVGRLDDAFATASLARTRCARVLGDSNAFTAPAPSALHCTMGVLIALEQHEEALLRMRRWGVDDPRVDPRAALAHRLAARDVRIVSAQLEP